MNDKNLATYFLSNPVFYCIQFCLKLSLVKLVLLKTPLPSVGLATAAVGITEWNILHVIKHLLHY